MPDELPLNSRRHFRTKGCSVPPIRRTSHWRRLGFEDHWTDLLRSKLKKENLKDEHECRLLVPGSKVIHSKAKDERGDEIEKAAWHRCDGKSWRG